MRRVPKNVLFLGNFFVHLQNQNQNQKRIYFFIKKKKTEIKRNSVLNN